MDRLHPFQNDQLAAFACLGMKVGRKFNGGTNQSSDQGRFRQGEIPDIFPEIFFGCRLNPVRAFPEIDLVQVEFENLVLCQDLLNPVGQDRFAQLPDKIFPVVQKNIPGKLLRDRAGPLTQIAGKGIGNGRADNRPVGQGTMLIEFGVFHGQNRVKNQGRHLAEGDVLPFLPVELANNLAISVVNDRCRYRNKRFQEGNRGHSPNDPLHEKIPPYSCSRENKEKNKEGNPKSRMAFFHVRRIPTECTQEVWKDRI